MGNDMPMNTLIFSFLLIVAFLLSGASHAQTQLQQTEKACLDVKSNPRTRIVQCTAYIESIKAELKKPGCPLGDLFAPPSPEQRRGVCTGRPETDVAKSFFARAVAYEAAGDLGSALRDVDEAIRRDAKQTMYIQSRAGLHKIQGNKQLEIADHIEVARQLPADFSTRNAVCWELALLGDFDRAMDYCNQSLRLMYTPQTLDSRAYIHLKLGEFDKAISDYSAALDLKPTQAESLYGRGIARLRKGSDQAGKEDVKAALAIDPQVPEKLKLERVR